MVPRVLPERNKDLKIALLTPKRTVHASRVVFVAWHLHSNPICLTGARPTGREGRAAVWFCCLFEIPLFCLSIWFYYLILLYDNVATWRTLSLPSVYLNIWMALPGNPNSAVTINPSKAILVLVYISSYLFKSPCLYLETWTPPTALLRTPTPSLLMSNNNKYLLGFGFPLRTH